MGNEVLVHGYYYHPYSRTSGDLGFRSCGDSRRGEYHKENSLNWYVPYVN